MYTGPGRPMGVTRPYALLLLIASQVLNKIRWNFIQNAVIFIQANEFENIVCKSLDVVFSEHSDCQQDSCTATWPVVNLTVKVSISCINLPETLWGSELNVIHRQTSNIKPTWAGNRIVDHSGVIGASPVGAAPTTSLFST